ncbi:MAG TPA: M90 family metallopeptidase [Steroidobacteraceae bacterium]|nr:M90 family metallopeptidase [Steroidobacteraceae bacterium]
MTQSQRALAVILSLGVLALVGAIVWGAVRARRRAARFREPFPPEWRALLERSLPLYRRIPPDLRSKLEPVVRAFLADVQFLGCRGLQVTDEMRLVIGVQACLLVVERDPRAYESLGSVLLYPDEFVVNQTDEDEAGVVTEGESVLSGQSLDTAQIVLSWQDVQDHGSETEIYNVVLHEFAHFLDNALDGALTDTRAGRGDFEAWHDLLEREYQSLCDAVERGEDTLIDPYGAESTVEFFAVATEAFFERPLDLQRLHPALYGELATFYGLDPAAWGT